MKLKIVYTITFIVALLIAALLTLPASQALRWASPYLPPQVQIGAITGTVWQGQISQLAYQNQIFTDVRWQVSLTGLLTAKLAGDVRFGNMRDRASTSGRAEFSFAPLSQALSIEKARVRMPVADLIVTANVPLPVNAKGRVLLDVPSYQLGQPYCQALDADLTVQALEVQGLSGNWIALGEFEGVGSCKSGDLALKVAPNNQLGLEADVILKAGMQSQVAGFVKPDASLPKEIHDAVAFLGKPNSEGRYPINF